MRRQGWHSHPCDTCHAPVDCDGYQEPNPDGIPDVWCRVRHDEHVSRPWLCDDCQSKADAAYEADMDERERAALTEANAAHRAEREAEHTQKGR